MEQAWLNWIKPVIKSGDLVCLLRPHQSQFTSDGDRVLLIHRFWVENEERRRHAVLIPESYILRWNGAISDDSDIRKLCDPFSNENSDYFRDFFDCKLIRIHDSPRGPAKYSPISSSGRLENGEQYFLYRFVLFWDGFEVTKGKSAPGEGIYMTCLNLPPKARSSPKSARIISQCPPGVKSTAVFKIIQNDIVTGMTTRFKDFDANGRACRIVLDLVGFLGDTPALNACLDTLGHTSNAFCHLCRYTTLSMSPSGSRYAGDGTYRVHTGTRPSFHTHTAVRDCGAQRETCRLLGMKHVSQNTDLPLHALRYAMVEARDRIPRVASRKKILTGHLDPYRACFIAPDHLLTGHLRDCINLAFKLLPNSRFRSLTETHMLALLNDCKLKNQNRIFDIDHNVMYSMSMTEIYALSVVAELSFTRACQELQRDAHPVSQKCRDAIRLVGSACRLIASLCHISTPEYDDSPAASVIHNQPHKRQVT